MHVNPAGKLVLSVIIAVLLAGCAIHHIDWNSRVDHYTYDQAIKEFGPPDKQARLTDGQVVAEWISRYYNGGTAVVGAGYYGYPGGIGIIQTAPSYYESKLRLTFATNNLLTAWSKD
jgi:hypothetical protein